MRDFVYVKDVCRAMIRLWQEAGPENSGIYNMGTGVARSFDDLVKATFNAMDVEQQIEYVSMPEQIRKHYQYYTEASMDKFKALFPDFTFSSLEEGVTDYVQNYLSQDNSYY